MKLVFHDARTPFSGFCHRLFTVQSTCICHTDWIFCPPSSYWIWNVGQKMEWPNVQISHSSVIRCEQLVVLTVGCMGERPILLLLWRQISNELASEENTSFMQVPMISVRSFVALLHFLGCFARFLLSIWCSRRVLNHHLEEDMRLRCTSYLLHLPGLIDIHDKMTNFEK